MYENDWSREAGSWEDNKTLWPKEEKHGYTYLTLILKYVFEIQWFKQNDACTRIDQCKQIEEFWNII